MRSKRGDGEHRHLGVERFEDDDEYSDASPLLALMFNHEPVDADPSLRCITFH